MPSLINVLILYYSQSCINLTVPFLSIVFASMLDFLQNISQFELFGDMATPPDIVSVSESQHNAHQHDYE